MSSKNKLWLGRKKIPMEKIQGSSHLQVTFSKRRSGIFKKASELSILCGVEVAVIVFSPAGKAFSFGQPSVDLVVDRILNQHDDTSSHRASSVKPKTDEQQQQQQYVEVLNQLEAEKKRGERFHQLKNTECDSSWEMPIDCLGLNELEQTMRRLDELKAYVERRMKGSSSSACYMSDHNQSFAMNAPFVHPSQKLPMGLW